MTLVRMQAEKMEIRNEKSRKRKMTTKLLRIA